MDGSAAAYISILATLVNLVAIIVAVFRLGRAVEKFDQIGTQQAKEITELKDAVRVVSDLITKMALQNQRLDNYGSRMSKLELLIEDLRRGEGYILPLGPKAKPSPDDR